MLGDRESERAERKESLDADRASEAICGFANDLAGSGRAGALFIGVTDEGLPTGLIVDDRLLLNVAGLRDRGEILPLPTMSVRVLAVHDVHVAVAVVEPALTPPTRYKGVVWVRVGPRRARASADDERRLAEKRRSLDLPFDARPIAGASIEEALDLELFRREYLPSAVDADVLAANGRTIAEQLASLGLATSSGEPTAAGVLLVGDSPRDYVPGAYVQFLRLDGLTLSDAVRDEKLLDGAMVDVLRQLDEVLGLNISTAVDAAMSPEWRQSDYPVVALQQLCRNALLHRSYEVTNAPVRITWYDDRVEIWSPGGPYGTVTTETFGKPGVTDYRNPVLASGLRALGYVQRFGVGLALARKVCESNGNPVPVFSVQPEYVAVTVAAPR